MKHVANEYTSMYEYKYMTNISKTIIVNEKQNIYIPNLSIFSNNRAINVHYATY